MLAVTLLGFLLGFLPMQSAANQEVMIVVNKAGGLGVQDVTVCLKGRVGHCSLPTDAKGVTRLSLGTKPPEEQMLELMNVPQGWVATGSIKGSVKISGSAIAGKRFEIMMVRLGDPKILQSPQFARALRKSATPIIGKAVVQGQNPTQARENATRQLSEQYGLSYAGIANTLKRVSPKTNSLLDAGEAAFYEDEFRTARRLLTKGLASVDRSVTSAEDEASAWSLLGLTRFLLKDPSGAVDALRRAHRLNMADSDIAAQYTMILMWNGDFERAAEVGHGVLKRTSWDDNPDARAQASFPVIMMSLQTGDNKTALVLTDEALQHIYEMKDYVRPLVLCSSAEIYASSDQQKKALDLIAEAESLKLDDKDAGFIVHQICALAKAVVAFENGDKDNALLILEETRQGPFSHMFDDLYGSLLSMLLGCFYENQWRYAEAERSYREAIESLQHSSKSTPQWYPFAQLGLARTLNRQKDFGEALKTLARIDTKKLSDQRDLIRALTQREIARSHWGSRDKAAISLYRDAIEALRKTPRADQLQEAYLELGDIFVVLGNLKDADKAYQSALAITEEYWPGDTARGRVLVQIGSTYVDNNLYQRAHEALHKALEMLRVPSHDDTKDVALVLYYLGRLASRQNDPVKAVSFLKETLSIERRVLGPESYSLSETEEELGKALWDVCQVAEAITYLRHAESVQGKYFKDRPEQIVLVRQTLGWALLEAGDYAGAREIGEKAYLALAEKTPKDVWQLSDLANLISRASIKLKDISKSQDYLKKAEEMNVSASKKILIDTWFTEALLAGTMGHTGVGLGFIDRVISVCKDPAENLSVYRCSAALRVRGELLAGAGDAAGAKQALREAVQAFLDKKYPLAPELAEAHINLADICHQNGELEQEEQELREAQRIMMQIFGAENPLVGQVSSRLDSLSHVH